MKALGYGKEYKYAHEFDEAITDQEYFPKGLEGAQYYHPTDRGREGKLREYLQHYREMRKKLMSAPEKKKTHHVLDDIRESIQELQHYRRTIFK